MKVLDRLLIALLVGLTISVIGTGGLAVYLTVNRQRKTGDPATSVSEATTAQPQLTLTSTPRTGETTEATTEVVTGKSRIAFVRGQQDEQGENVAIFTINTDGSNPIQVSEPSQRLCLDPAWSPDGGRIAYVASEEQPAETRDVVRHAWISTVDGAEHVRISSGLSNTVFVRPAWSPDGTRLAFTAWDDPEATSSPSTLHIARTDGSGIERSIAFPTAIQRVMWSPTADRLLIVSGSTRGSKHTHVISSDGTEVTEVFRGSLTADWAERGEAVIVSDYTAQAVLLVEPEPNEGQTPEPRTLAQLTLQPVEISWAPGGAYVAACTSGHYRQGYATNLDVIAVETGEVTTVSEGDGWIAWPRWSPDGQRLVFTKGRLHRAVFPEADLWIYDPVSEQAIQLTSERGFEGFAVWSP